MCADGPLFGGVMTVVSANMIFITPRGVSDNGLFCAPPEHVIVLKLFGYHHAVVAPRHKDQVLSWEVCLSTDDHSFALEYLWIQRRENAGRLEPVYFAYDAFGPILFIER